MREEEKNSSMVPRGHYAVDFLLSTLEGFVKSGRVLQRWEGGPLASEHQPGGKYPNQLRDQWY